MKMAAIKPAGGAFLKHVSERGPPCEEQRGHQPLTECPRDDEWNEPEPRQEGRQSDEHRKHRRAQSADRKHPA